MATIVSLAVTGLALSAAVASAHTGTVSADCAAAHFKWTAFGTTGTQNNGNNTPTYSITVDGGQPTTGSVSFKTASFSKDVPLNLSAGQHTVYLKTSWTAAQTNDGASGEAHGTFYVTCGTLEVKKHLSPATDSGRFDIGAAGPTPTSKSNVGDGGSTGAVPVTSGSYTISETATTTATKLSDYDSAIWCEDTAHPADKKSGPGTSLSGVQVDSGDAWVCTITNIRKAPAITVVKDGPATAYSGDTLTFTFKVTNSGNQGLSDVTVGDDHCSPVSRFDNLADPVLDPGQTWTFKCSTVATHTLGDTNPVINTVTATGHTPDQKTVTDTDQHSTRFLHPGISLDKSGPATATAGLPVVYALDVVNTGDVSFAAGMVSLADAQCEAPPALSSTNGDGSAASLDPGDHWTYSCTAQTTTGQTQVVNVGSVTATDTNGRQATAQDQATTQLVQPQAPASSGTAPNTAAGAAPQQGVSPVTIISGTARLHGPVGCARASAVTASVTGRRIVRVTYTLDGKRVRTLTKPNKAGRWTLSVRTRSVRRGEHRIVARVQFTPASHTATRTLRITFVRCRPAIVRPNFTG